MPNAIENLASKGAGQAGAATAKMKGLQHRLGKATAKEMEQRYRREKEALMSKVGR
jgi:hypothetical protein